MPSLAERQGEFSALDLCTDGGFSGGFCNESQPPALQCLSQPALPQQPVRHVFASLQSRRNLLGYFPAPNNGTNVYTATQVVHQDSNQFGVRLDHISGGSDILNFRYAFSDGTELHPIATSGASVPGFPVGQEQRAQNFVAQETHTFSPCDDRRLPLLIFAEQISLRREDQPHHSRQPGLWHTSRAWTWPSGLRSSR